MPSGLALALSILFFSLGFKSIAWFAVFIAAGAVFFFRDPERRITSRQGGILSPADGQVVSVGPARTDSPFGAKAVRVSVFMSIFNAHINRCPIDGKVLSVKHIPGGFRMAHLEGAGIRNERVEIVMEDGQGRRSLMVQVAGFVARRIVCRLSAGDLLRAGQRFGLICFGSRVDLYLPPETEVMVNCGDRVRAGVSVVGVLL